jgi:hypothetical protein
MALTSEQKQTVSQWVAAGDNLSQIQQKITEQFKVSMTYMDVRFLVDDLNLQLKDPKPVVKAQDLSKTAPSAAPQESSQAEKKGFLDRMKEKVGLGQKEADEEGMEEESVPPTDEQLGALEDEPPAAPSGVVVNLDKIVLIPGALASGSVTFSDGVTGKWIIDQYGRPGFTEISQPGYRPSQTDAQAFMQELTMAIQGQQPGY